MSLEVELDCDGLLSNDMVIDTDQDSNSHSILRNAEQFTEDEFKELEESDNENGDRSHRKSINEINNFNLDMIKQRELMQHLEELKREFASRINILESNLDSVTNERDTLSSKVTALQQEKEYLQENTAQCNRKYNQCHIALQSANEEIRDLKTELTNLQILYEEEIKMVNNENTFKFNLNQQINDDNPINRELQQYMKENLEIRKENKKYLDQLKQINDKYRESNTKYNDLNNIQIDLQNELNLAKSRCAELTDIVHEYFSEIQSLENQNADLRQTLSEIRENHENLFDKDGNAIEIDYAPTESTRGRGRHFRTRSYSQVSAVSYNDSVANSPVVNPMEYVIDFDLYDIDRSDNSKNSDGFSVDAKSDEMEKFYDLYEAMNDYLEQMQECVQSIKTIQLLKNRKNKSSSDMARASSFHLLSAQDSKKSVEVENKNKITNGDDDRKSEDGHDDDDGDNDERRRGENRDRAVDEDEMDDDEEDDIFTETLMNVLETNDDEIQLTKLHELIQESKDCVTELNKQQMVMMDEETKKYEDLDAAYKHHQIKAARQIKQLTKDMYSTRYKKYGGYRQIGWEMVSNVGTYTKDAIVHKLTH